MAPNSPLDQALLVALSVPDEADLAWTNVPWRSTLWDAVIDANRDEKPILLWAMNGHALGCT